MTLLTVENLIRDFPIGTGLPWRHETLRAVDGVSFSIAPGETLSLVGESGCGKSTVGRMIVGLLQPSGGSIAFEGHPVATGRARARQMQIVFQDPFGSLNPQMTVGAIVAEPAVLHGLVTRRETAARTRALLALVGLPEDAAERYPHEFSGGQRQRIAIARALAAEPKLIVCDEAVSALDVSVQAQITNLLRDIQQRSDIGYLFISHGLSLVHHISHRVAVMYLGRIVEIGPVEQVFAAPRHPYTRALIAAAPEPRPVREGARPRGCAVLEGEVPSPLDPPSGCRFHTRCPHATALCATAEPVLGGEGDHAVACHHFRTLPPVPPLRADTAARTERVLRLYRRAAAARAATVT